MNLINWVTQFFGIYITSRITVRHCVSLAVFQVRADAIFYFSHKLSLRRPSDDHSHRVPNGHHSALLSGYSGRVHDGIILDWYMPRSCIGTKWELVKYTYRKSRRQWWALTSEKEAHILCVNRKNTSRHCKLTTRKWMNFT